MKRDIVFTAVPPPKTWSRVRIRRRADEIAGIVRRTGVRKVSIPEAVREKWVGNRVIAIREKVDSLEFGRILKEMDPHLDIIVNRNVPLMEKEEFERWIGELSKEFDSVALVGGESSRGNYPGYSVIEATYIAKKFVKNIYGITIFHREKEGERLLKKSLAGMDYFFSQIVFDAEDIFRTLEEYYMLCERSGIKPAKIYISVAPISRVRDMEFLRRFRVKIPSSMEERILRSPDRALELSLEAIFNLLNQVVKRGFDTGINVEHVMMNNMKPAEELIRRILEIR